MMKKEAGNRYAWFMAAVFAAAAFLLTASPARAGTTGDYITNLQGYYTLDETSGTTANDTAGVAQNGTMQGGMTAPTSSTAGPTGKAMVFDGVNDYIDMTDYEFSTTVITVAAWVKFNAFGASGDAIVSKWLTTGSQRSYMLFTETSNKFSMNVSDNGGTGGGALLTAIGTTLAQTGVWYHVAGTFNNATGTAKIYVNGILENTATDAGVTGVFGTGTRSVRIGNWSNGTERYLNGAIDDVRIYDRLLGDDDIKALYTRGNKFCNTPLGTGGQIDYSFDRSMMQYCDGDSWNIMGLGSYTPSAVTFDGTNDYLARGGDLTGLTDSKKLTGSIWFRRTRTGTWDPLYMSTNSGLEIGLAQADDKVYIVGKNVAGTEIATATGTAITDKKWHHLLFSYDLTGASTSKRHFYIDGVNAGATWWSFADDIVDFTKAEHKIGGAVGFANLFQGDLADLWLDYGTYIDFSSAGLRQKFRSANGMPMYLGSNGSLPTGYAPDVFLTGDTASWPTNKGLGGGFTVNGALTYASSQIPYTSEPSLTSGLIGHWKLDETSGSTAVDSAGTAQNGTYESFNVTTTIRSAPGKFNGSFVFASANHELVQVADHADLDITGPITLTAWINPTQAVAGNHEVINKKSDSNLSGYQLKQFGAAIQFEYSDGVSHINTWADDVLVSNKWQHIAATYDQQYVRIYLDGVLKRQVARTGSIVANNFPLRIGGYAGESAYWGEGQIDDARVYNRALTAAEIQLLATGACANPAAPGGTMMYNADYKVMQYCNGVDWVAMSKIGGTGGGGCASPAGTAGQIRFASADEQMQYCNSQDWVNIGKPVAPTSGLVGYWRMDEVSGSTIADSSTTANAGTWSDSSGNSVAQETGAGQVLRKLHFDGVDDKVTIANNAAYNNSGTWAFWMKTNGSWGFDNAGYAVLMDRHDGGYGVSYNGVSISMSFGASGTIGAQIKDAGGSVCDAGGIKVGGDNVWHHVAFVFSRLGGATSTLYVDGVAAGSCVNWGPWNFNNQAVLLGDSPDTWWEEYQGDIDDVRIYNRALSTTEIKQLYEATK